MNRLSTAQRAQIVMALVEGNSIRSTSRMTGVAKGTILSLLEDMGEVCAKYHDENVRKVQARRIMLAIYFMYYNFCRVHQTLRVTPAMEAGLSDHVWSISELVALLDKRSILHGLSRIA
jgi:hypothetical protein